MKSVTINVVNNTGWDLLPGELHFPHGKEGLENGTWDSRCKRIPKDETGNISATTDNLSYKLTGRVDYVVQDNDRTRLTVRFTGDIQGQNIVHVFDTNLYTCTSSQTSNDFPLDVTITFTKKE